MRSCYSGQSSRSQYSPWGHFYFPIQSWLVVSQERLENINRVLTHLRPKVFPLSLGWFLLDILPRLQRGQPAPETNWNPWIWVEREDWLLKKMTHFQSDLSLGTASWCPIFSPIKSRHFLHPISNCKWPSLELNGCVSLSPKLKTRWKEHFIIRFFIYVYIFHWCVAEAILSVMIVISVQSTKDLRFVIHRKQRIK